MSEELSEVEQRLLKDFTLATQVAPEAASIIIEQGQAWGANLDVFGRKQFKQAEQIYDAQIEEVEQHIVQNPDSQDALAFTLARAYVMKGHSIAAQAVDVHDVEMMKEAVRWMDLAFDITEWPPQFKALQVEAGYNELLVRIENGGYLPGKTPMTANQSKSQSNISPQSQHTKVFKEVKFICPRCKRTSSIELVGKCDVCTYDMELFNAGEGLNCIRCGIGFVANFDSSDVPGVIHCAYTDCRQPIPATPRYITPVEKSCFIATAAYGSPLRPEISVLRQFREEILRQHFAGRLFITFYEWASPPLAKWIENRPSVRSMVRQFFLEPVISWLKRWQNRSRSV